MELPLFEEVAEALRGLLPADLGFAHHRARQYGIKVWFGQDAPPREHYEAQVIGARHVKQARTLAMEVGFHAEHPRPADNDEVLAHLLTAEHRWRRELGDEAVAGPFLGRPEDWRRVSEAWPDPDLSDPSLRLDVGLRLVDYITALEPLRRSRLGADAG